MLCEFPYRESPLSLYLAPHAITPSTGPIEKKLSTYFGPHRTKLVGVFVALYQVWKEVKDVGRCLRVQRASPEVQQRPQPWPG